MTGKDNFKESLPLRQNSDEYDPEELQQILPSYKEYYSRIPRSIYLQLATLYTLVVLLSFVIIVLLSQKLACHDPALAIWSPANEVVSYKTITFERHFFKRSPWIGRDVAAIDAMWADIYDFGTSSISAIDAKKLLNATLPTPNDPDTFVIELEVFHDLHCLNMLRKLAYPDEYPEMWDRYENGTVNHDSRNGLHIDHCLDSLRQEIMCMADVTPMKFHHNLGDDFHIFPDIYATHTCKDFDAVRNWAAERQVEAWKLGF